MLNIIIFISEQARAEIKATLLGNFSIDGLLGSKDPAGIPSEAIHTQQLYMNTTISTLNLSHRASQAVKMLLQ